MVYRKREYSTSVAKLVRPGALARIVRAYILKEDLDFFSRYRSARWAGPFLDRWCSEVMRSRIEPMKSVARTLRSRASLILNWFRSRGQISTGVVEGLNDKLKVVTGRAYGFRELHVVKVALYHALRNLPEPTGTHRSC